MRKKNGNKCIDQPTVVWLVQGKPKNVNSANNLNNYLLKMFYSHLRKQIFKYDTPDLTFFCHFRSSTVQHEVKYIHIRWNVAFLTNWNNKLKY